MEEQTQEGWPSASSQPTFGADELVGGRYRVTAFLGQGAVGEVYAAHDLELGAEIALKALRPRGLIEAAPTERFKREILLARRVSHPNVCRIFDLGVHLLERPGQDPRPILFLTMELLDGQTLVRRVEEGGPLAEAAALPIALQLARGLEAAHTAGVVHRDLKSSNVLLVAGTGGDRAVITDFGLARDERLPSGATSLTATGGVLGTPAYMAPEQVEGRRADARSDLYAMGVVLYEMVTGQLPFEGESPLSVAVKRLSDDPVPIERWRSDLSPRFRAVVRRCLERNPNDRFADGGELARALEGQLPALAPRRRRRRIAIAAAVVAALAGGWAIERAVTARARSAAVAGRPAERSAVAVLALRNANDRPEHAWLGAALAEMLTTELGAGDALRAVPGEAVARARADLALAAADALAAPTLARLHRALDADWIVSGAYTALGEAGRARLRLDLRLQSADGGRTEPLSVEGDEAELFALAGRAGAGLRRVLGVAAPAAAAQGAARASLPASAEAVRLYAEGLEKLRTSEPLAARERLEAAVAADPEAALAWAALSRAWGDLGYSERALAAARTAWEHSERLPRADALRVEASFRLANGEREPAIENLRALWRFYPDDLEQGLLLADALLEAERATEALELVAELRALPAPARDDPRIDLAEANAAERLSDFRRQLAAAQRAAARAEETGSRHLASRAWLVQGVARRKLGEPAESRAALSQARRLAAEAGDRSGVAATLLSLANLERGQGRLDEAGALFAEARVIYGAIGNPQRGARAEIGHGQVLSAQGDVRGALALYESALAKLREVGDRRAAAAALSNTGTMRYELGELDAAHGRLTEALAEFRALGDPSRVMVVLQNLAQIHQDRGELDAAGAALEETLEIARRIGERGAEGYALKALGDLDADRGRRELARASYSAARDIYRAIGQEPARGLTEMAMAALDRGAGKADVAESELARLAAEFERAGQTGDRDEALAERARALIDLGRVDEAGRVIADLSPRAAASDARRVRHHVRLAEAELAAARGNIAGARRVLAAARAEAAGAGLVLRALEAQVAEARCARAAGAPEAAKLVAAAAAEARRIGAGRLLEELGVGAAEKQATARM